MLGKGPDKCAEYMVRPLLACATGENIGLDLPNTASKRGVYIMKEDASAGKLTKGHTNEAIESCWKTTKDVLHRAGIELEV